MTKQEQIEEIAKLLWNSPVKCPYDFAECPFGLHKKFTCNCCNMATALYDAGFRKIFMSDIIDAEKALKAGYNKGYNDGFDDAYSQGQRDGYDKGFENAQSAVRKETAKEILDLIVDESGGDLLGAYYKLPIRTYNKIKREYGVGGEEE